MCDFEDSNQCGFIDDMTTNFNWTRNNGRTASGGTGPQNDHTYGTNSGLWKCHSVHTFKLLFSVKVLGDQIIITGSKCSMQSTRFIQILNIWNTQRHIPLDVLTSLLILIIYWKLKILELRWYFRLYSKLHHDKLSWQICASHFYLCNSRSS